MTTLTTKRLILRPYTDADFDQMAALHGEERVMAEMRDGAVSREEARGSMDSYLDFWQTDGISIFALVTKEDGIYNGECGFWVREGFDGRALRYILAEPFWGQGFAKELAFAALDWGFRDKDIPVVNAVSKLSNPASARILQNLGMTLSDRAHKGMEGFHRYTVTRAEWLAPERVS